MFMLPPGGIDFGGGGSLGVEPPRSVRILREIMVLGEWINSHALSYFFLTMPDFVGAAGGVFELMESHPEITRDAFSLRNSGLRIVEILGKRTSHPVTIGVGQFNENPTHADIEEIHSIASDVKERVARLIHKVTSIHLHSKSIAFPEDQQLNFASYDSDQDRLHVYTREGELILSFSRAEFMENISELRADWTLAKFPYLSKLGFPAGIMLVGPLSRSFQESGPLYEPLLSSFDLTGALRDRFALTLESYDACRLLEIFWAANRIISLLEKVDLTRMTAEVNLKESGQGIGVLEAPRGILMHHYLVDQGRIERMRLLVATQFNNAYINLLLRNLAEQHLEGDSVSPEGERMIGRCVRIFDPCLSCATH